MDAKQAEQLLLLISDQLRKTSSKASENLSFEGETTGLNLIFSVLEKSTNKNLHCCLSIAMSENQEKLKPFVEAVEAYWKKVGQYARSQAIKFIPG